MNGSGGVARAFLFAREFCGRVFQKIGTFWTACFQGRRHRSTPPACHAWRVRSEILDEGTIRALPPRRRAIFDVPCQLVLGNYAPPPDWVRAATGWILFGGRLGPRSDFDAQLAAHFQENYGRLIAGRGPVLGRLAYWRGVLGSTALVEELRCPSRRWLGKSEE
jgi:hypothetical protein